jgi:TRAP-type mannitol/chloroaromatic compound transport system permease large subunit
MAVWIAQNMAPIMFASLVVFLLLGYPVAFSLGACGLFFFIIGVELAPLSGGAISLSWPLLQSLPERVFGVMANDTLLAIPFFTLMGLILERSGMAEDLLDTIGQLFGTVRGGLAYAVIFVGALLAATTGVVAASVISMGLISLPIMLRYGYDRRVAAGVIAASGTLAQIIPPSLVLIVMADQLGKSVGDMYDGAFIPGIVLAALYALYIFLVATFFPAAAPGLPKESVGFKEDLGTITHGFLARASGLMILVMAGYFLYSSIETIKSLATSADWTDKIWPVIVIAAVGYLAQLSIRFVISGQDERGLSSLLALTLVSAAVGYGLMDVINAKAVAAGKSVYKGADFVVLCMAIGIVVAFSAAVVNWIIDKLTGARFLSRLAQQVTFVMVPPLFLIFLVLGTIFIGVATPTEGGAMGAMGAIILAMFKRWLDGNPKRFNFPLLRSAVEATAKLSAFVVFILVGARIFSLTFYGVNGHLWVEHLLVSLPGGQTGFLIFVNIMVFLLAFFLDFFELAFIIIPLLGPAAEKLGIDLIWFGVMLGVNMQTSFMHPPFGFALFYLRSVAAKEPYKDKLTGIMTEPVTTGQIYWGAVPFVVIQCIMVGLVIAFPRMVMHYKSTAPEVDVSKVEITVPTYGGGLGVPNFGIPGVPSIPGLPPIGGPASAPSIPGLPPPPTIPALPPALTAPDAPKQ